jgi:hypothetical protein
MNGLSPVVNKKNVGRDFPPMKLPKQENMLRMKRVRFASGKMPWQSEEPKTLWAIRTSAAFCGHCTNDEHARLYQILDLQLCDQSLSSSGLRVVEISGLQFGVHRCRSTFWPITVILFHAASRSGLEYWS